MDASINIRALRDDDVDGIVSLYDRATATDANIGPVPHEMWKRFVMAPQNRDGRDFRVALCGESLVGLAESSIREQSRRQVRFFKLIVEPSMRRRGIGSALLEELLTLDPPSENLTFQSLASQEWAAGLAFLSAFGFLHIESELGLRCVSLKPPKVTSLTDMTCEHAVDAQAFAADVARIHNLAFSGDVAFRGFTAGEMSALLEDNQLWLARDGARIVGFCRLEPEPDLTWLEALAVDPQYQGRGIGAALTYVALKAAGVGPDHPVGLNVSSANPAALSVYRRLGFELRREMRRFSVRHQDLRIWMEQRRQRGAGTTQRESPPSKFITEPPPLRPES